MRIGFNSNGHERPVMSSPAVGDQAPTFKATYGTSEHEPFDLQDEMGAGAVVLAFFPGAFTPPCTNEMVALQDSLTAFEDTGARVYGVSADSPFSQGAFRDEHDIAFDLVSDMAGEAISAYGLEMDIEPLGLHGIANRAVFVIDESGEITYRWIADDPTNEPDYAEVIEAANAAAAST